ncbi:hypothetical protein [Cellulomonas shaoxiangyii]|uniref:Uncharacterized protein n=1 Tax=Cellulomonas shaoxiangyii TaxID=2566013 RepID=A0A4P7SMP5_9CELL|nr:hypothetical protein [Cellulomonas shaoxiangyii]QCB95058.1 hypothetical protein E5225_17315 [Cellulomonas shaoxiangyii]TGY86387.1 hypothetical protein E5226_02395 [Cellulomonas shaoxiangyii]
MNYETDEDEEDDTVFAGPLIFDRAQYETELQRFIATFHDVRASLPAPTLPSPRDDQRRRHLRD